MRSNSGTRRRIFLNLILLPALMVLLMLADHTSMDTSKEVTSNFTWKEQEVSLAKKKTIHRPDDRPTIKTRAADAETGIEPEVIDLAAQAAPVISTAVDKATPGRTLGTTPASENNAFIATGLMIDIPLDANRTLVNRSYEPTPLTPGALADDLMWPRPTMNIFGPPANSTIPTAGGSNSITADNATTVVMFNDSGFTRPVMPPAQDFLSDNLSYNSAFGTANPDDIVYGHDHGVDESDPVATGMASQAISPASNDEPTSVGHTNAGTNLTLDFAFLGQMPAPTLSKAFDTDATGPGNAGTPMFSITKNDLNPVPDLALTFVPPTFSKAFAPATIGPGSVSTLTFTLTNSDPTTPVSNLAFSDTLPAGVVIATPSNTTTTCTGGGGRGAPLTLTAPDGGTTISFSGGVLPVSSSCTISVDVTSSTPGTHMNVSGDLTSSAGNSGAATADLTVTTDRPDFSKSFSPSSIPVGGTSTLTFTIDNTANAADVFFLQFNDSLPTGMVIASPSNASTDCTSMAFPATLTATSGTSVIQFMAFGFSFPTPDPVVAAGSSCTVTVDVTTTSAGTFTNTSGELLSGTPSVSSGFATAVLDVTVDFLAKSFIDDPVPPGGTVTLQFTINNLDRDNAATSISFDDDLDAVVMGLAPSGPLPSAPCGAGSSLAFAAGTLSLTGGSLPAAGACMFSVTLAVPGGAASGTFPNTTSAITADIGGVGVTGNMATDMLRVAALPIFTKEFIDDPVGAGGMVTLRFTITNTSPTSSATDIAFTDDLNTAIMGLAANGLVSGFDTAPLMDPCGTGSELTVFDPPDPFPPLILGEPDPTRLIFSGGSLAPAGSPGDSCTFDVTLDVPVGTPAGTFVNTTSDVTATVDGGTVTGPPATDGLMVVAAPRLLKEFTDDPVQPGSTVTLEFTLIHSAEALGDATAITFTDDLAATLPGLTAVLPPTPDPPCGAGSSLTGSAGDTLLTFSGGSLMPGQSCTFSVTLNVPGGATPGSHTNTTSTVSATVLGMTATENAASDDLVISNLQFTKEFIDDPVIPGSTATLRFTIDNMSSLDATGIIFTDNLNATLSGLTAAAPLPTEPCGMGSSITGTSLLTFTGGNLTAGASCMFDVTVQVPAGAADGMFNNTTSNLTITSLGGSLLVLDPATDVLIVDSNLLSLTKEFTDDPAFPGGTATLEFTLTNLDVAQAASNIAFTDDLAAALAGLAVTGLPIAACGGTVDAIPDAGTIDFSGGSLAAGDSCMFSVTLTVPSGLASGTATNTTSQVTGTIGGLAVTGNPASDDLLINLLGFSKSFDGPTTATGTATLTFMIENLSNSETVSRLGFSDNLDDVIPGLVAISLPSLPCGAGSNLAGTSFLTMTGGNLGPLSSCMFDVTVQVPQTAIPGGFLNTTSDLFASGIPVANPATATLTVEPPPLFGKSFSPATIFSGQTSTLTFTIDNTASALAASGLDFTDNLPAGVMLANPPNTSTTCTGGTLTAVAGTGVISYTGGSVAAGASCTVQVHVTSNTVGIHVNTSGDLTSSSGSSGTASDTLTVNALPVATKTVSDATSGNNDGMAQPGETLTYTIVVTNNGAANAINVSITDAAPANTTYNDGSGMIVSQSGATGAMITTNTGSLQVDIADLAGNGGTITISFTVTVDNPTAAGVTQISNTAQVSATGITQFDSTQADINVDAAPDVEATKTDALLVDVNMDGMANPGDTIKYTIVITNNGNQDADAVMFNDTPDANTTLVSGSVMTTQGTITGGNAGTPPVMVDAGTISGGGGLVTIMFEVTINNPVPVGLTDVCNQGTVSGSNFTTLMTDDPDTGTGDDETCTPVVSAPLIEAQKTVVVSMDNDMDGQADPGDRLKYTIVITNSGDQNAGAVMFDDTPDANTTLVAGSVMTTQGTVTGGNAGAPPVVVDIGTIAGGGGSVTIIFEVTVNDLLTTGTTVVSNQGQCTGSNFAAVLTDDPGTSAVDDATVISVNRPPVAVCQDVTVTADENCQGVVMGAAVDNGSSDPDGDDLTFSLDPPGPYPLGVTMVTLTVTDEGGLTATCTATITVMNEVPVVDAGEDQLVSEGDPVMLEATATDPDADQPLEVMWTQLGGPMVVLAGADTLTPAFTAPDVVEGGCEVLTFQVKVTDPCGAMVTDTVTVNVEGAGAVGLVLQDDSNGNCVRIFPCAGTFSWRLPDGTVITGMATVSINGPVLNFQGTGENGEVFQAGASLLRRTGTARLTAGGRGGQLLGQISDSNLDDNDPCP